MCSPSVLPGIFTFHPQDRLWRLGFDDLPSATVLTRVPRGRQQKHSRSGCHSVGNTRRSRHSRPCSCGTPSCTSCTGRSSPPSAGACGPASPHGTPRSRTIACSTGRGWRLARSGCVCWVAEAARLSTLAGVEATWVRREQSATHHMTEVRCQHKWAAKRRERGGGEAARAGWTGDAIG